MSQAYLNQPKPFYSSSRCGRWTFYKALIVPFIAGAILMALGLAAVLFWDIRDAVTGISILLIPRSSIMWLMMIKP